MTDFEAPSQDTNNIEARHAVPTEFPLLDARELGDQEVWDIEERVLPVKLDALSGLDFAALQPRWQIEQRLGAINDAREAGTITPEVADALELDALRKLREVTFDARGDELRVPLSIAHEIHERSGGLPINVPKPSAGPERRHIADYKVEF